jgi:hypothetical protein
MSTDVSEVRAASIIALMMEAACTSESSVDIDLTTRQQAYIPEDAELHTRRHENLKSHKPINQSITELPNRPVCSKSTT